MKLPHAKTTTKYKLQCNFILCLLWIHLLLVLYFQLSYGILVDSSG